MLDDRIQNKADRGQYSSMVRIWRLVRLFASMRLCLMSNSKITMHSYSPFSLPISPVDVVAALRVPKIRRRIEWIRSEAASDDAERDLSVVSIMRALSNYFTVGALSDDSARVKLKNRIMSKAALSFLEDCKKAGAASEAKLLWIKGTTNEHPFPLIQTWKWIVENPNLAIDDIGRHFHQNPMVTVTKAEDTALNQAGHRHKGSPSERYAAAGIFILSVDTMPIELITDNIGVGAGES